MSDFIERLQVEKNDLSAKQERLRLFIDSSEFSKLTDMEQEALRLQARAMADYYGILNQRLYFYETGNWPFLKLQ